MADTLTVEEQFAVPQEVADLGIAFPAHVDHLMPEYAWLRDNEPDREWVEVQRTWFFHGLSEDTEFILRDGIDGSLMLRHLRAVQGSFAPKHEHKEAAVAWLLSRWCKSVRYGAAGKPADKFAGDPA